MSEPRFIDLRNGGNLPRRRAFPPSVVLAGWMIAAFGMAFLIFAADLSPKVAAYVHTNTQGE